jgi:hypothetical protein
MRFMSAFIATGYREVRAVPEEDSYLARACRLVADNADRFRAPAAPAQRLVRVLPRPTPPRVAPARPRTRQLKLPIPTTMRR